MTSEFKSQVDSKEINFQISQTLLSSVSIFIYDSPVEYNDFWLNRYLKEYIDQDISIGRNLNTQQIFGNQISTNVYNTDQFMLEAIFHYKILRYKNVTNDIKDADFVYFPCYLGIASLAGTKSEFNQVLDNFCDFVKSNNHKNFILPLSRVFQFFTNTCKILFPQNVLILTIEKVTDNLNVISVPYPCNYYSQSDYYNDIKLPTSRNYLVSICANLRKNSRQELLKQFESSRFPVKWMPVEGREKRKHYPTDECTRQLINLKQDSIFSLEPAGDTQSRKSIYESINCGSIPVFFEDARFHLPFSNWVNWEEIAIFIRGNDQKRNVIEILHQISDNTIYSKYTAILKHRYKLQYSVRDVDDEKDGFGYIIKELWLHKLISKLEKKNQTTDDNLDNKKKGTIMTKQTSAQNLDNSGNKSQTTIFLGVPLEQWNNQDIVKIKNRLRYATFVSSKGNYIYCETPKVACSSLKKWIHQWENLPDIKPSFFRSKETKISMFIHQRATFKLPSLMDFESEVATKMISSKDYFKFAFVRNPYARLFSGWLNKIYFVEPGYQQWAKKIRVRYQRELENSVFIPFEYFVKFLCENYTANRCNHHFQSQVSLIYPHAIQYDFIGKLEKFKEDFNYVIKSIGSNESSLKMLKNENASFPADWKDYYDENLAKLVYQFYIDDFQKFDYDQDSWKQDKNNSFLLLNSQNSNTDLEKLNNFYRKEIYDRNQLIDALYSTIKEIRIEKQTREKAKKFANKEDCLLAVSEVEGWLSLDEASLLYELASSVTVGCIVEVGSYRGRSTVALGLGSMSGAKSPVYAIDPHEEFVGPGGGIFGPQDRSLFYENMLSTSCYQIVRLINLSSEVVTPGWNKPVELLWIDGDHSYEGVKRDFEYWLPHLTKEAYIVFDDTRNPNSGPGRLVNEILEQKSFQKVKTVGKVIVMKR